jgi:RimJ/RimL family protein N-acetyltransferase
MIETERLVLKPLIYDQLLKYIKADGSLEVELNLHASDRTISPELREALEQTILPNVADPSKDYLYSTLWTIISKEANSMVGDLCIVGAPNENGEIEIGYGTYDDFTGRGFMTEAVGGIIKWASLQASVTAIIAATEKDNIASQVILQKNNFIKIGETDTLLNWKLSTRNGS